LLVLLACAYHSVLSFTEGTRTSACYPLTPCYPLMCVGVAAFIYTCIVDECTWRVSGLLLGALQILIAVMCLLNGIYVFGAFVVSGLATDGHIIILILRHNAALQKANQEMEPLKVSYDKVWRAIMLTHLEELHDLAQLCRQHANRKQLQPTSSLDHLFHLATNINEWYQDVVRAWARRCGCAALPAELKSVTRAKEKLWRSYKCKSVQLCDLVRSTVVADSPRLLHAMLSLIVSRVRVHTIKKGFEVDYDGKDTGGYRDLNLQITFPNLDETPFEGFVFELQLHSKPIFALKGDDGHRCYVRLRNLRGD